MGGAATGVVTYSELDDLWRDHDGVLAELGRRDGVTSVAELGGGANPIVADEETWGFLHRHPVPGLSSFAVVVLRKPSEGGRTR
ncbi:hypothetical protein GCM10009788_14640 [Nocardioides humi]|uniref:Uncharacterized protein n=1 Tax=Nocardioides humi TaxID=449461 RepID=A0ABN2A4V5_9ACTN